MERRRKHGYVTPPRTALDELGSELRREKEQALASGFVSDDIVGSEEDRRCSIPTCYTSR